MTVTFCGHSSFQREEDYERKIITLLEKLIGDASAEMYLGGYGAFDEFAYHCCQKYKADHPNVKLVFITPYLTPEYQNNHLQYQITKYDSIIYPDIENKPLKFAISYRNKWMAENADFVIAFVEHSWGGAYQTYRYAKRKGKTVFNISDALVEIQKRL